VRQSPRTNEKSYCGEKPQHKQARYCSEKPQLTERSVRQSSGKRPPNLWSFVVRPVVFLVQRVVFYPLTVWSKTTAAIREATIRQRFPRSAKTIWRPLVGNQVGNGVKNGVGNSLTHFVRKRCSLSRAAPKSLVGEMPLVHAGGATANDREANDRQ